MDKRKVLEELQEEYSKVLAEYTVVREDAMDYEGDEEYNEYMNADEVKRAEQFPEKYAMYQKKLELENKLEQLNKEQVETAKELNKELDASLTELEEKQKALTEQRDELSKEIEDLNDELKALKKTDEYKNGDEQAVKQAEQLESKLRKVRANKGKLTKAINAVSKEIEALKEEKTLLVSEYGEEILVVGSNESVEPTTEKPAEEELLVQEEETEPEDIAKKQLEVKQMDEQIASLESEVTDLTKQYEQMMKDIREKDKEILDLKASEAYKNKDKDTLLKVENLEKELQDKVIEKNRVVERLAAIRKRLNDMKKQLVEQYGDEVLNYPKDEVITANTQVKSPSVADNGNNEQKAPATSKKNAQKSQPVVYAQPNRVSITEQPKTESEKEEKTESKIDPKQEFDDLYAKARNGNLTEQDFARLAEIMQDTENYDKLGITTGIVFNKSKVILKAMAKVAADTKKTARLSRDELRIEVKNASEENGYLATSEIKSWKGLKTLMKNPDKKIASEEVFRKVLALDRATLTDEQKVIWDKAQSHMTKFGQLKNCLNAYEQVSTRRMQKNWSWLFGFKNDEVKPLPQATGSTEVKIPKIGGLDMSGLVKYVPDAEIKARGPRDAQGKDER